MANAAVLSSKAFSEINNMSNNKFNKQNNTLKSVSNEWIGLHKGDNQKK